ncbi:MAG TPA: hypothetical protein VIV11_19550 [Kofleriaceae bacterium]
MTVEIEAVVARLDVACRDHLATDHELSDLAGRWLERRRGTCAEETSQQPVPHRWQL